MEYFKYVDILINNSIMHLKFLLRIYLFYKRNTEQSILLQQYPTTNWMQYFLQQLKLQFQ